MSTAAVACGVAHGPSAAGAPGGDSPPAGFMGVYIASDSDDSGDGTSGEVTPLRAKEIAWGASSDREAGERERLAESSGYGSARDERTPCRGPSGLEEGDAPPPGTEEGPIQVDETIISIHSSIMRGLDEVLGTMSPTVANHPPRLDRTRSPRLVMGHLVSNNDGVAEGSDNPMNADHHQIVSALQTELDRQVVVSEHQEAELCALRVHVSLLMDQLSAVPALLSQHGVMATEMCVAASQSADAKWRINWRKLWPARRQGIKGIYRSVNWLRGLGPLRWKLPSHERSPTEMLQS